MPIILIILFYCYGWIWARCDQGTLAQQPRDRKATCCHGQCAWHNGRAGGGQQPRLFAAKQPRLWEQTQGLCCHFWRAGGTLKCSLALTGSKARSDFLLLNLILSPSPQFLQGWLHHPKKETLCLSVTEKNGCHRFGDKEGTHSSFTADRSETRGVRVCQHRDLLESRFVFTVILLYVGSTCGVFT